MSTALVTGASGFVGGAVARHLLEAGWDVRALVRPASLPGRLWPTGCEPYPGDLLEPETIAAASRGVDAVFHAGAHYSLARREGRRVMRVNVEGTRNVLGAAAERDVPVVHTSSVATVGLPASGAPGEEATPLPRRQVIGAYKRSKLAAEQLARAAAAGGQRVVIVNPTAPVGPGDHRPTPTGRVVRDAAAGRMPVVVDTGLNVAHVDDVAAGHLQALQHGRTGRRYILGGDNLTLKSIVSLAAVTDGRAPVRATIPHALGIGVAALDELIAGWVLGREPRAPLDGALMARKRMWVTSARAEAELGYSARPSRRAIADAVAWFTGGTAGTPAPAGEPA